MLVYLFILIIILKQLSWSIILKQDKVTWNPTNILLRSKWSFHINLRVMSIKKITWYFEKYFLYIILKIILMCWRHICNKLSDINKKRSYRKKICTAILIVRKIHLSIIFIFHFWSYVISGSSKVQNFTTWTLWLIIMLVDFIIRRENR